MIHFVVHGEQDSVGVVVVDGVKSGQQLNDWIMDLDKEIKVRAQSDIPIGHKLAIQKFAANDTVIKYGVDIGRSIAPIKVGEHAHVYNIRTKLPIPCHPGKMNTYQVTKKLYTFTVTCPEMRDT